MTGPLNASTRFRGQDDDRFTSLSPLNPRSISFIESRRMTGRPCGQVVGEVVSKSRSMSQRDFLRREFHVDLHRGFTSQARRYIVPQRSFWCSAFFSFDRIQYLRKQVPGFRRRRSVGTLLIATVLPESRIVPNPSDSRSSSIN